MDIPKDVSDAMYDILENYEFTKKEKHTIAMFIITLREYSKKA